MTSTIQLANLKQFSKEEIAEISQSTDGTPMYTRQEESGRTLEAIAKMANVGHMTAFQYDKIQTKGTVDE
jgi:hypothetical protein